MAQPESKLKEQATRKADLSYSYWAAKSGETGTVAPQLLTPEEAALRAAETEQLRASSGASAWNSAGTFEERGVGIGWVREQLDDLLNGLAAELGGRHVRATGLKSVSGEANQWLVRGKKRGGFDLDLSIDVQGRLNGGDDSSHVGTAEGALGTAASPADPADASEAGNVTAGPASVVGLVKIPNVSSDDLDEIQLDPEWTEGHEGLTPAEVRELTAAAKALRTQVMEKLTELLERVKSR